MSEPKIIKTKIRGVSHKNNDGSNRQAIIRQHIRPGKKLLLGREPDNPYSPDGTATSVWYEKHGFLSRKRYQLGYLGSDLSHELAPLLDLNWRYSAIVLNVTGGNKKKPSYGVNIQIEMHPPA